MAIKIEKKIVGYEVVKPTPPAETSAPAKEQPVVQHMHENVQRPEALEGSTYKIKTPLSEHALYVTINDIVLNPGTEHEQRRPFEIFINSKNMDHFQWIVALTRIISAVFRKGGDVTFLVEELKAVFDPKGGYFKKGGKFMPSLVAEIGDVLETHLRKIGVLQESGAAPKQPSSPERPVPPDQGSNASFPADAMLCPSCRSKAMIALDGCLTCLNCADSKCG